MNQIIFSPDAVPVSGMRTSVNAASLSPGELSNAVNVRFSSGSVKIRRGAARVGSSPAANPQSYCVAAWGGRISNTYYLISVWDTGASVFPIYSYNLTSGAWTEITATSGEFGNTRMSQGAQWSFAVVRNPLIRREVLIIGNNSQAVRVYDPGSSYGSKVAINASISVPGSNASYVSQPTFPVFFTVKDASTTTYTNSDAANFSFADSGASTTDNYIVMTRGTGASTDPTAIVQFSSSIDLSNSNQLVIYYESSYVIPWDAIKVEIGESGTYTTVWDPESSTLSYSKTEVPHPGDTSGQKTWVAFSLGHVLASSRNAVNQVRFTWVESTPSASVTLNVYLIAGSGVVQGQTYHALSYSNQTSGGESRAVIITNIQPQYMRNLGAANTKTDKIPNVPGLWCNYTLTYLNTSTTDRDLGVDRLIVYRMDYGDPDGFYAYVTTQTLASYAGSWSYSSGTELSQRTYTDTNKYETKDLLVTVPDEYVTNIPYPQAMIAANDRLFVSKAPDGFALTDDQNELWISDSGNPFRFRAFNLDESGGTVLRFQGEYVNAFAYSSSSAFGENTIWAITNRRTYRLGGFQTSTLSQARVTAPHGTYWPNSVAEYYGSLYFLSTENKVLRISAGGIEDLTESRVEDKFSGVYSLAINAQAVFFNNRYYVSVDDAGNQSGYDPATYIYETRPGPRGEYGWSQDTLASSLKAEFWATSDETLYFIGSDKYVYQHEKAAQTTDQGSAFTATLTSGLWRMPTRSGFTCRSASTVSDQNASGAVAYTVTYLPTQVTQTASANLTASTAQQDVVSGVFSGSGTGPFHGKLAKVQAVYTLPGGSEIFDLVVECEESTYYPTAL